MLTLPFTMLREVKMQVELPELKKRAISELGYGANAKVLVGFNSRVWQKLGYTGATYSDQPFQLAWDNSFMQPGVSGGLTLYSGGKLAHDAGQGTAEEAAVRLMAGIERAYPGTTRARNGKVSRFHWPTFPWVKGSLLLLQAGPVDDDRGLRGPARREPVLRRRALQLRLPGLHERRGTVGCRYGQSGDGEGQRQHSLARTPGVDCLKERMTWHQMDRRAACD